MVDTRQTEPAHGGALILVDEDLNVASVRMYNETQNHHGSPVKVETVGGLGNPLSAYLAKIVNGDQEPWLSFSGVVAETVEVYHKRFRERLNLVKTN